MGRKQVAAVTAIEDMTPVNGLEQRPVDAHLGC
jgi:hypothetical protein